MGMSRAARMMMMDGGKHDRHSDETKHRKENTHNYDGYSDDYDDKIRAGGVFWVDNPKEHAEFDQETAKRWAAKMQNADGSMGAHWTLQQTTGVAQEQGVKFEHITDYCWWITMNMIYSDYCAVAVKHNCNTLAFYVDMAKAFLFDKDAKSPKEKVSAYYEYIVK